MNVGMIIFRTHALARAIGLAALLIAGAAQAALDSSSAADTTAAAPAAAGPDEKSSKTLDLLLQMQDSASAPAQVRSAEMPTIRLRNGGTPGGTERNAYADTPAPSLGEGPGTPGAAKDLSSVRPEGVDSPVGGARTRELPMQAVNADAEGSDLKPSKALGFLREHREIAIGSAVLLLVLVGVVGARGRKR